MKDYYNIVLIVIGVVVAGVLFMGFVTTVQKMFKPSTAQMEKIDSSQIQIEQQRRMQEINERQRRMMDEQKQRIRDGSR